MQSAEKTFYMKQHSSHRLRKAGKPVFRGRKAGAARAIGVLLDIVLELESTEDVRIEDLLHRRVRISHSGSKDILTLSGSGAYKRGQCYCFRTH